MDLRLTVRNATDDDRGFVVDMLVEAASWCPARAISRQTLLADPKISHYVDGWMRPSDEGAIAEVGDQAAGAAWLRYFTEDDPGYGFVGPDVPELSIGVVEAWRGRGVGRLLMRSLHEVARFSAIGQISLSVERGNRARDLYLSLGYEVFERFENAETMVIALTRRGGDSAVGGV